MTHVVAVVMSLPQWSQTAMCGSLLRLVVEVLGAARADVADHTGGQVPLGLGLLAADRARRSPVTEDHASRANGDLLPRIHDASSFRSPALLSWGGALRPPVWAG